MMDFVGFAIKLNIFPSIADRFRILSASRHISDDDFDKLKKRHGDLLASEKKKFAKDSRKRSMKMQNKAENVVYNKPRMPT